MKSNIDDIFLYVFYQMAKKKSNRPEHDNNIKFSDP